MSLVHVRRFWFAGIVLAFVVALLPFSFHAERHLETATRVEGSQAEIVRQELADRFHSPFVDRVVLVVEGVPPADSDAGEQALTTIVAALRAEPGVSGVVSHLELRDPIFLGKGGGTFVLIGLASTGVRWSRSCLSFTYWQTLFKTNCGVVIRRRSSN